KRHALALVTSGTSAIFSQEKRQASVNSITQALSAVPSPENSRTMKEKSHRVPRRCYRSGVWTLRGTQTRRLDGHSLYNADAFPGPRDFDADYRPLRSAARQFRRRRHFAEGGRRSARPDMAPG